jgi:hypothetical protein
MLRTDLATLNFHEGVFDLRHSPAGTVALSLDSPRLTHVEEDLNWGTNGWDVDALVEEIDGKWWNPDADDEVAFTRRLFRIAHAFKKVFNLNFVPCVRRRFKPNDGHVWLVILMTRTKRHADAIRARTADLQRRIGSSTVQWTLPLCGVFQLVTFTQAMRFWSKLRMDSLTDRATSDHETEGRRLYIGDLHAGVSREELAAAITHMGYHIQSEVELVNRHWGITAYVTLASNDEAVDLILRSDSLMVGDPPCRLKVKAARPREAPCPNYPSDDAFTLLDQQQSAQHGAAHGMTDAQVASVTDALQRLSETSLKAVIDRLTGSVTGLPAEFQAALAARLEAIEASINLVASNVQQGHTILAQRVDAAQAEAVMASTRHESRLERMEHTLQSILDQMFRFTESQDDHYGYDPHDFNPDPAFYSAAPPPKPTFAEEDDPNPAHPQPPQPTPAVLTVEPPPAVGGADLSFVRTPEPAQPQPAPQPQQPQHDQPQSEQEQQQPPTPPPQQPPSEPQTPVQLAMDVSVAQGRAECTADAKRRAESPADERAERGRYTRGVWEDQLYDEDLTPLCTPPPAGTPMPGGAAPPSTPMDLLGVDAVSQSPMMELAPGYTVAACGRLIQAWNSLSPPDARIQTGRSAGDLLRNAQLAATRLYDASSADAEAEPPAPGRARAREALAAALPNTHIPGSDSDKENRQPQALSEHAQPVQAGNH